MQSLITLGLAFLVAVSLYRSHKKRSALAELAECMHRKHLDLQNKAQVVTEQAIYYSNTLGGKGAKMIAQVQTIFKEQEEIFSKLELLLKKGSLDQAEEILSSFTLGQMSKNGEKLLSEVAGQIASASKKASRTGVPKFRKRSDTALSLKNAGLISEDETK